MRKIVLATNNPGKVREIKELFKDFPFEVLSLGDVGLKIEVREDRDTFKDNALKKAMEVMRATGEIALADDSGLEVDALGGQPGIYSARFAGEGATDKENNEKLLKLMEGVPEEKRKATFRCAIAMVYPDGEVIQVEGCCRGRIAFEPRGNRGFGYDPLFVVEDLDRAFAELEPEEKNKISHRGIAFRKLKEVLMKKYNIKNKG